MFLALKEMKKEKGRFFLIISIFVLISYLVYFLLGLAYGLAVDNKTAIEQWDAPRIVLSQGSNVNISSSMIDQEPFMEDLGDRQYALVNVSRSAAYINRDESDGSTVDLALFGLNPEGEFFPEILEGDPIENDKDVIASSSLRDEDGMEIGDELELSMNGSIFTIVGFTDDYKFNTAPVIYTKLAEASPSAIMFRAQDEETSEETSEEATEETSEETSEEATEETDQSEDVDQTSGATTSIPPRVSAALMYSDDVDGLDENYDVVTMDEFINNIPGYYAQVLTFGLMIGFLILIAAIVLGVFLYIITIQKKEVFGIMKIQGISNSYIGKSVIIQTFLVSLIGIAIGLGLTLLTRVFLPVTVPFTINWLFYAIISLAMMLTAQLGAIFSVKTVSKVDPLEVI